MAGEPTTVMIGNLTHPPEIRFLDNGNAVVSFTIAQTPRTFDKASNEWKDGDPLFMRCSAWRGLAENIVETLDKGMRVIATGRLRQRSFEKDGVKRTVVEMEVDEIGPALTWATAKVTRVGAKKAGDTKPKESAPAADDDSPPF